MPSFSIKTFGCKVNLYNTQLLQENLHRLFGFTLTDTQSADFLLINACVVTKRAEKDVLRFCKKNQKKFPACQILVFGCLSTELKEDLQTSNIAITTFQEMIKNFSKDLPNETQLINSITSFQDRTRAFIKVQTGCNQFCSYCIVPLVRGNYESRNPDDILMEVKQIIKAGYKEIVLTGTQIGLYQGGNEQGYHLLHLMKDLEMEYRKDLYRVRISSIGPTFISNEMIDFLSSSTLFCNHMHLSLQSGSDEILKKMNRKYTVQNYLDLVSQLKQAKKDFCISTDMIVGFPGETEQDFHSSLDVCRSVSFSKIHVFPFSPRLGTSAYQLKSILQPEELKKRTNELLELSKILSYNVKRNFIGKSVEVLIEEDSSGFTTNYLRVVLQNSVNRKGQLASVSVGACDADALYESNLT